MFIKKIATALAMSLLMVSSILAETTAPPIEDVKVAYSLLEEKSYAEFYEEWCHPHVKEQLSKPNFIKHMEGQAGEQTTALYSTVLSLYLEQSSNMKFGPHEEEDDEYQFRFNNTKEVNESKQEKSFNHLELKLDGDKWKLKDID